MTTSSLDSARRPALKRFIDFRPGMDMWWEIVRNGEDTDGELLEANAWLGPHSPSPPVHVHDNVEDSFEIIEGRLDVKLDGLWRTYGPRQAIYAAMLFRAHPTAIRTSRVQRFAFASLSGLGRMLGMSL